MNEAIAMQLCIFKPNIIMRRIHNRFRDNVKYTFVLKDKESTQELPRTLTTSFLIMRGNILPKIM